MPDSNTLLYLGAGFLAAEATGVTNFTGGGDGDSSGGPAETGIPAEVIAALSNNDSPTVVTPPSDGGSDGIDPEVLTSILGRRRQGNGSSTAEEVSRQISGLQSRVEALTSSLQQRQSGNDNGRDSSNTTGAFNIGGLTIAGDSPQDALTNISGAAKGAFTTAESEVQSTTNEVESVVDRTQQEAWREVRDATGYDIPDFPGVDTSGSGNGGIVDMVANAPGAVGDFLKENPIATSGTGAAALAAAGGPLSAGTAATIAGGSVALEVGSDAITGGKPMGVDSWVDITEDNWYQGPDPLGIGPAEVDGEVEMSDAMKGIQIKKDKKEKRRNKKKGKKAAKSDPVTGPYGWSGV